MDDALVLDTPAEVAEPVAVNPRSTLALARATGDISGLLSAQELATLGSEVVEDYERDLTDRKPWQDKVEAALKAASQERANSDNAAADFTPIFDGASDVRYPILTVAALQFNARAYPAIFKGDEVVQIKVVGKDAGRPQRGPDGQPAVDQAGKPLWDREPGGKSARAGRVKDYMNVCLAYRVEDWEADTDALLLQLPIAGCAFRKLWWDARTGRPCASLVPALRLVVPTSAKTIAVAPRVTEEVPDVYPYQIVERMRAGTYREVVLPPMGDDREGPRMLLEQHRRIDMDDDGLGEPYIVTVDKETRSVLRVEANYSPRDLDGDPATGRIDAIRPGQFYVKYGFFPHPEGKFYDIGFGHLLSELGAVIDTTINQMIDAGYAQIAGGGWIASGLRLQDTRRSSSMRWQPGEYKTVNVSGPDLRAGIVERTFPNPSPVMFQMLDLMLGAARDIAAIKDVTSGEASNQGQVGTTLALIEQGLQVFTATYKRVYRALREEYQLLFDNLGRYGDQRTANDYQIVLDDDRADFAADFRAEDMDIRPVSDPGSVTRMQKMARAQFLDQMRGKGLDDGEINRRVLEAADIEDADKLIPPQPQGPPPQMVAELEKVASETKRNNSAAALDDARTSQIGAEVGHKLGEADGIANAGGMGSVAGPPGEPVGIPGAEPDGGPAPGPMDAPVMGGGPVGPAAVG